MKFIKAICVILVATVVGLLFYNAAFKAAFEPDLPLGAFRSLGEAPSDELGSKAKYKIDSFDGGYASKTDDQDKALYLLSLATFNEAWLSTYAYMIKASGTANYAGLDGSLISNSAHVRNDEQNFVYHRWINAMEDKGSDPKLDGIKEIIKPILSFGSEEVTYQGKYYRREAKDNATRYDSKIDMNTAAWRKIKAPTKASESLPYKEVTSVEEGYTELTQAEKKIYSAYSYKNYVHFYKLREQGVKPIKDVTIELVNDEKSGKQYYKARIIGDVDVINADRPTMEDVISSNSPATSLSFIKYELEFEVWKDSGLFRSWTSIEDWDGAMKTPIASLSASTTMSQPVYYSYDPLDYDPTLYLAGFKIIEL